MLDYWLDWIQTLHPKNIEMGLDRSRQVYSRLLSAGIFHTAPFVVTVGGTNGKGTTLKLLENAAVYAGFIVGSYTSPHLFTFNERVRLNGDQAEDARWVRAFKIVENYRHDIPLTYYEFTTLAAFVLMAAEKCNIWLLEVGLGGRFDTVNLLDAHLAVITSIALDHEAFLGDTREKIAAEKIQIARKGRAVFLGGEDVLESIQQFCFASSSPLFDYSTRKITVLPTGRWSLNFSLDRQQSLLSELPSPKIPLQNAALGLQVWVSMAQHLGIEPWRACSPQKLLATTQLFGRFSRLRTTVEVWVDAAHNPAAATLLASAISALPMRFTTAICGIMADKDIKATMRPLIPCIDQWILVALEVGRALPPEDLRDILVDLGVNASAIEIVSRIAFDSLDEQQRYLVFGSFYTIEQVIQQEFIQQDWCLETLVI